MSRSTNERNSRRGRPDTPANIGWWYAQTESVISRHSALLARDVAETDLRAAWRAYVAAVKQLSSSWPAALADRVGRVKDPEMARTLGCADDPRTPPPAPRRYLRPEEILKILSGPAAPPWPTPANDAIRRAAGAGQGIELYDDGGWIAWDPALGIPAQPVRAEPILRPLFKPFTSALARHPATIALLRLLEEPAPLPMPVPPTSSLKAREQYRIAAAAFKRRQTAGLRGGFRRRDSVIEAMELAQTRLTTTWFSIWPMNVDRFAGDRDEALRFASRLRGETLATLSTLEGLFPKTATTPRRRRRTTTRRKR